MNLSNTQDQLMWIASLPCPCHHLTGHFNREQPCGCSNCNGSGARFPTLRQKCPCLYPNNYHQELPYERDEGYQVICKRCWIRREHSGLDCLCKGDGWMLAENIRGSDVITPMIKAGYCFEAYGGDGWNIGGRFYCRLFIPKPGAFTDTKNEAIGTDFDSVSIEAVWKSLKEEQK